MQFMTSSSRYSLLFVTLSSLQLKIIFRLTKPLLDLISCDADSSSESYATIHRLLQREGYPITKMNPFQNVKLNSGQYNSVFNFNPKLKSY